MQIHNVSPDELDYVAAVCMDPSVPKRWQETMAPLMIERKKWLKAMMKKGLGILVALENPAVTASSLGFKAAKVKQKAVRGSLPEGLIEFVPIELSSEPAKGSNRFSSTACGLCRLSGIVALLRLFWRSALKRQKPMVGLASWLMKETNGSDSFRICRQASSRNTGLKRLIVTEAEHCFT
jgi:hypothetical protein